MRPRTRRVLELALEVAVPIVLVAVLWVWTAQSDTFYYPPLSDVFAEFGDNWLFERFGSDVWPSLRRMFIGYAVAARHAAPREHSRPVGPAGAQGRTPTERLRVFPATG